MGAVLGIAAFGRTQEKLAGTAANPTSTVSTQNMNMAGNTAGGYGSVMNNNMGGGFNNGYGSQPMGGAPAFGAPAARPTPVPSFGAPIQPPHPEI
jgi:hypothetical protein